MALEKCCLCCKLENGAVIWGTFSILIFFCTYSFITAINNEIESYGIPIELYSSLRTLSIIEIITSILLMAGAVMRNHYAMMPWIVVNGIILIPCLPVAFLGVLIAVPFFFPYYIWWCMCSAYQRVQEDKIPHTQMVNIYTTSNLVGHPTPAHVDELRSLGQHSNSGYVPSAPMPSMATQVTMPHNDVPPKYDA